MPQIALVQKLMKVSQGRCYIVPKQKYKYQNPALQPTTDTSTETETETSTLPSTKTETYTSTYPTVQHRKRGSQAFERTHERITLWIDKGLKQRFEALADEQGQAK